VRSKQPKGCTRVAGIENRCWTLETGWASSMNNPLHSIWMVLKVNRVHLSKPLTIEVIVVNGDTELLEASAHGSCVLSCVSDIEKFH
jgi:hypothetical protein